MVTKNATLITKKSTAAGAVPTAASLQQAELAINTTDRKLYSKDAGGNVFQVAPSLKDTGPQNIKNYGARMVAGVDDAAAVAAAYAAAPSGGTIEVPPGKFNISAWPTGVKAGDKVKLWQFHGATSGESGNQVIGVGSGADTQEFFGLGSKFFLRTSSYPDAGAIMRIQGTFDHANGSPGATINTLQTSTTVTGVQIKNFVWAVQHVMYASGWGGNAEHVGLASTVIRPIDALNDGHGARDIIFAGYDEVTDLVPASAGFGGAVCVREIDLFSYGDDRTGGIGDGSRNLLGLNIGRAYNESGDLSRVGFGISLASKDGSWFGRAIRVKAPFDYAVIDLTEATALNSAARHIIMAPNAKVSWGSVLSPVFDMGYAADGLFRMTFLGSDKLRIANDNTNAVYMLIGGSMRSVTIKAQSALSPSDNVMVAVG